LEAMLWKRCGEKGRGFMECSVVSIICCERQQWLGRDRMLIWVGGGAGSC
jgi:hypothetical protein